MVNNTVHENGKECLDVKMYESLTRNEDGLISHTRIFRDDTGHFSQRVLFRRATEPEQPFNCSHAELAE